MASPVARIKHRTSRRPENRQVKSTAPAVAPGQASQATQAPGELPSREALIGRLEAQRAELLRAMSCVNLARRTIEEHVARPPFGGERPVSPEQHEFYRQRVLEALSDAAEGLRTAYPLLERIAQALAVEEILKEHTATVEASGRPELAASEAAGSRAAS